MDAATGEALASTSCIGHLLLRRSDLFMRNSTVTQGDSVCHLGSALVTALTANRALRFALFEHAPMLLKVLAPNDPLIFCYRP